MRLKTKFYFDNRVGVNNVIAALENIFNYLADSSAIRHAEPDFKGDHARDYGFIRFPDTDSLYFYPYNHISGGSRNCTCPDTISMNYSDQNVEILRQLGAYFGGYLNVCDSDDEEIYIEKTLGIEPTSEQKLRFVLRDTKTNIQIIDILKEHIDILTKFANDYSNINNQ